MNKFIKIAYYNLTFIFFIWFIVTLYNINLWLCFIGVITFIVLFIYLTPIILNVISNNF